MSAPANRLAPIILLIWGVAATIFVGAGMLTGLPFPPPALVGVGVLLLFVLAIVVPGFAAWMKTVDIRFILGFHLIRFIGFYFLWLASVGRLDPFFAEAAGIGDIVTAVGATGLLLLPNARDGKWLMIWNIVGMADILFVVATAARVYFTDSAGIVEFFGLPLGLLPTFFVPVVIVSHLVVFLRLRTKAA